MSSHNTTGQILEAVSQAGPIPQVEAALNDDLVGAGIVGAGQPEMLVGSTLFNVATAAADALRVNPGVPVIERPVSVPNKAESLGRFTLRILNTSLQPSATRLDVPHVSSSYVERERAGAATEQYVLDALKESHDAPYMDSLDSEEDVEALRCVEYTDELSDPELVEDAFEPSLLLVTEEGRPALLKVHGDEPVGVTFMPFVINGVVYPSHQLVSVEEVEDIPLALIGNLDVARMDGHAIDTIGPLRFAVTALEREQRRPAIRSVQDRKIPKELVRVIDRITKRHLEAFLPDQAALAQAYADLGRQAIHQHVN